MKSEKKIADGKDAKKKKEVRVAVYGLEEEAASFIASLFRWDGIRVVQILGEEADPKDLAARIYKILLGVDKECVSVRGNMISVREVVPLGREVNVGDRIVPLPFSEQQEAVLVLRDQKIEVSMAPNPREAAEKLFPDVDVVVFTQEKILESRDLLVPFLNSGARQIVLTFPSQLADITIIPGVNDHLFDSLRHKIISAGDSAGNCAISVAAIVEKEFGEGSLAGALVVEVRSRSADQQLGDKGINPMEEGLLDNLILTSAVEVKNNFGSFFSGVGKAMDAFSIRTPVEKGSILVMMFQMRARGVTKEWLQGIFRYAAKSDRWRGIVNYDSEHGGSKVYQKSTACAEIFGRMINVWPGPPEFDLSTLIIPAACSGVCGYGWQIKRVTEVIRKHL